MSQDGAPQGGAGRSWARPGTIDYDVVIPVLVSLLEHDESEVRYQVPMTFRPFGANAAFAMPILMGFRVNENPGIRSLALWSLRGVALPSFSFFSHSSNEFHLYGARRDDVYEETWDHRKIEFYLTMGECGFDRSCARRVLEEALESDHDLVRADAICVLVNIFHGDESVQQRVLTMMDDPSPYVRHFVLASTEFMPLNRDVKDVIRQGIHDEDQHPRSTALRRIEQMGDAGRRFTTDVETAAKEFSCKHAASSLLALGGDPDVAVGAYLDMMLRYLQEGDSRQAAYICDGLRNLDVTSQRAADELHSQFDHGCPHLRSAAAVMHLKLGGDDVEAATDVMFDALDVIRKNAEKVERPEANRLRWLAQGGRFDETIVAARLLSDDRVVRLEAIDFLGHAGAAAQPLRPQLRDRLDDPDSVVRRAAKEVIAHIEELFE